MGSLPKAPALHADGGGVAEHDGEEVASKVHLHLFVFGADIEFSHANIELGEGVVKTIENAVDELDSGG